MLVGSPSGEVAASRSAAVSSCRNGLGCVSSAAPAALADRPANNLKYSEGKPSNPGMA